ncbi:MAG: ATP phosphoribosyltransferase regulatory subunit [Bryobacterales bacterium]|nr:ATP phosphoribosyltransferase regulatory subunit [Bryobacterales bacterium]
MPEIPPPRATRDYLPEEAAARRRVLSEFSTAAESYGFQPVETPSFEKVELFSARSGSEIKSSMLTFHCDHEEFALRPELTAPVCRLIASGAFDDVPTPLRLYYTGSCFRYTRPGSGRYREFTQAGVELIGESGPEADAEVIALACRFLRLIGVKDFTLRIGTLGIFRDVLPEKIDPEDRAAIIGHLDMLAGIRELCATLEKTDDRVAFEELKIDRGQIALMQERSGYEGPHAVKDKPEVTREEIVARMPDETEAALRDNWSKEGLIDETTSHTLIALSRLQGSLAVVLEQARKLLAGTQAQGALENLVEVCRRVETYGVKDFEVHLGIARGLTFYTGCIFEILQPAEAGGKKLGGGGRYDNLTALFGGDALPAVGCAFRFDALMAAFEAGGGWTAPKPFQLYLKTTDAASATRAQAVAEKLRDQGMRVGVGSGDGANAEKTVDAGDEAALAALG